jgi:hypothetical protein
LVKTGGRPIDPRYLAGFLDGEGCFRFQSTARVEVTLTYPHILQMFAETYGGSFNKAYTKKSKRQLWRWLICGSSCRRMLLFVIPYLEEKKDQAALILRGHRYPPRSAMREQLERELGCLKRINHRFTL